MIGYLGRYTHRVAISNSRLISLENDMVKFRWKDYRDHLWKVMALEAKCFIRRFLQHILPCGYYKIRYYGIFSSVHAKTTMQQCFALLNSSPGISQYKGLVITEVLYLITGHDLTKCPQCKTGRMMMVAEPRSADDT